MSLIPRLSCRGGELARHVYGMSISPTCRSLCGNCETKLCFSDCSMDKRNLNMHMRSLRFVLVRIAKRNAGFFDVVIDNKAPSPEPYAIGDGLNRTNSGHL